MRPEAVQAELRQGFVHWGLPRRIRVDNGAPWGSRGDLPPALAMWAIGLGIDMIWNRPYRSQDNAIVERGHGVTVQWVEPEQRTDPVDLQQRVIWAIGIQREKYPSVGGLSRMAAYPGLLTPLRQYDPSQEDELWQLERVLSFLSQGVWARRVDKAGYISLYNWPYLIGRSYRGLTVSVRLDATSREWVIADDRGTELRRHLAQELTRERIMTLNVVRKKKKRN